MSRIIVNVATGETTVEPDFVAPSFPIPVRPRTTLRAYLKMALSRMGKLEAVEAVISAAPAEARLLWNEAVTFSEADPELIAIAAHPSVKVNVGAVFDICDQIAVERRHAREG